MSYPPAKPGHQPGVAEAIGGALNQPVQAVEIERDAWEQGARDSGMSRYQIETLLKMFAYYAEHGFWGNSRVLAGLLGRRPTSFLEFLRRELRPPPVFDPSGNRGASRPKKMLHLPTISAAPGALDWVRAERPAHVLHVFAAACNLINDGDDLLSLILQPGPLDPFTLLLKQPASFAGFAEHISAESIVTHSSGRIRIDDLEVVIDEPMAWTSRPDWDTLRVGLSGNLDWIDVIEGAVIRSRTAESLAALIGNPHASWEGSRPPWWAKAAAPVQELLNGITSRDERALSRAASRLAGLGPGLTPSGDDFLIGLMYAARIMLEPGEADTVL